jgi:hypothetical protein
MPSPNAAQLGGNTSVCLSVTKGRGLREVAVASVVDRREWKEVWSKGGRGSGEDVLDEHARAMRRPRAAKYLQGAQRRS